MDALVAAYGFDLANLDDDPDFDDMAYAFAADQQNGDHIAFTAAYPPTGAFAVYPHAGAFGAYPPTGPFAAYPVAGAIALVPPQAAADPVPPQAAADPIPPQAAAAIRIADPSDEDPKNPWTVVKSRKFGRRRRGTPEVYPPSPPEVLCEVEVPKGFKTGSLRDVRRYASHLKSGSVSTRDGPGRYVFGSHGPHSLEF